MVEAAHHRLSITAQCRLLRISRSSYYYAPVPETDETLALMTVIDATFMDCPWYGSRQMARHLRRAGHEVGRRRVRRLMAKMGLTPIYQRPHERSAPAAPGLSVSAAQAGDRAAQSGLVRRRDLHPDAPRLPLSGGDHGLGNRKVLAWRLSNTMDAGFCVAALEEALARSASPKSSTPTRAASSPASPSPACCATPRSASAWMAGAGGWTMSSSSASGDP
jgi:putative transposase